MSAEASQTPDINLDQVMRELDRATSKLPEKALRTVQAHRELFIPRLIESLEDAAAQMAAGKDVPGNAHFFALYLLTEFQAKEAWPAILKVISLPGEGPYELYGDTLTEYLSEVLALYLADAPDELDALIANRDLYEYVRWEAAQALLHLVRDGKLSRDEAVRRLHGHLREAIAIRDRTTATLVVTELVSYAPHEALEDIRTAYAQGLVDEMTVRFREVEQAVADGDAELQRSLELCRPTGIADTVAQLKRWYQVVDRAPAAKSSAGRDLEEFDNQYREFSPTTIINTEPRIGRNDPCPCGSGKKYKKCCGAA